ncbi:MAG TPA: HDOD domain-containing protein [Verrucomicrobiae bacterium]|nr:HDOD domain-containing protein [Verrucomicrobiae bacterium]
MTTDTLSAGPAPASAAAPPQPLTREQIENRLKDCPRLPSLGSINSALRELLGADHRYTSQVAEIIRRDPSLTARLLRLVNSVYYGLSSPVNNIEEAVFYLGVRQIRQLVMVTPIIEDFQRLAGKTLFPWRNFWQHCIGTAILTREVISAVRMPTDDVDYVCGLIHDVGKIALAAACPEHFDAIYGENTLTPAGSLERERAVLGMDHAELGAIYLASHHLPDALVEVARYHHRPERASHHVHLVAAVQIADLLIRHAAIGNSGNPHPVSDHDWLNASGWTLLFPSQPDPDKAESERGLARMNLKRSLDRLPTVLEGLV